MRGFVAGTAQLEIGQSRCIRFRRGRRLLEAFVLRNQDGLVAFSNECPHWHVDLDLGTNDFWDPANQRILCRNHGALFHPQTGVCERGPCLGLALEALELTPDGDGVWLDIPNAEPEV